MALQPPHRTSPTPAPATITISATEFKATCLELMDEVARTGTEVIVTKHGRPVVRVSAVTEQSVSPIGFMAGTVLGHGDIITSDPTWWETSPSEPLLQKAGRRPGQKAGRTPEQKAGRKRGAK